MRILYPLAFILLIACTSSNDDASVQRGQEDEALQWYNSIFKSRTLGYYYRFDYLMAAAVATKNEIPDQQFIQRLKDVSDNIYEKIDREREAIASEQKNHSYDNRKVLLSSKLEGHFGETTLDFDFVYKGVGEYFDSLFVICLGESDFAPEYRHPSGNYQSVQAHLDSLYEDYKKTYQDNEPGNMISTLEFLSLSESIVALAERSAVRFLMEGKEPSVFVPQEDILYLTEGENKHIRPGQRVSFKLSPAILLTSIDDGFSTSFPKDSTACTKLYYLSGKNTLDTLWLSTNRIGERQVNIELFQREKARMAKTVEHEYTIVP